MGTVRVVHAIDDCNLDEVNASVFLAGPTPRFADVQSWRPEAVKYFIDAGFDGALFYPETEDGKWQQTYTNQVEWEHSFLNNCDAILMWVPRELDTMPAFTTNIEFGLYIKEGRLFYGCPKGAPKTAYMDYCYYKFTRREPKRYLEDLVNQVVEQITMKGKK